MELGRPGSCSLAVLAGVWATTCPRRKTLSRVARRRIAAYLAAIEKQGLRITENLDFASQERRP